MSNEIELKLRIRAADVPRLRRHPALRAGLIGKPVTRKLTSIYYDTPQLALLDADLSLRVRRMSGGWFQAVKGGGQALAGLHTRMEWEDLLTRGEPDFDKITEPALKRIFDNPALRAALRPIFTTEVRRTEWQLQVEDSLIEMALDTGELIVGTAREPISEVELELKRGHATHLFEFALRLIEVLPLWIENVSKAQRGYAHYRPQPPGLRFARQIALPPEATLRDAGRAVIWECLAHLQGNHDLVMHAHDTQGWRQMRRALERLNAAVRIFSPAMPADHDLLEELAWLDTALVQPAIAADVLESQRYQRLLLALGAWLEHKHGDRGDTPFATFAHRSEAEPLLSPPI